MKQHVKKKNVVRALKTCKSRVNIICFLLLFVPLVYFVLPAFYTNLFFNMISPLYHYIYSLRLKRELTVI